MLSTTPISYNGWSLFFQLPVSLPVNSPANLLTNRSLPRHVSVATPFAAVRFGSTQRPRLRFSFFCFLRFFAFTPKLFGQNHYYQKNRIIINYKNNNIKYGFSLGKFHVPFFSYHCSSLLLSSNLEAMEPAKP